MRKLKLPYNLYLHAMRTIGARSFAVWLHLKQTFRSGTFYKWSVRSAAQKSGIHYASIARHVKGWLHHGFCRMVNQNLTFVNERHLVNDARYYLRVTYKLYHEIIDRLRAQIVVHEINTRQHLCKRLGALNANRDSSLKQTTNASKSKLRQTVKLWVKYENGLHLNRHQKRVLHTKQAAFDLKVRCSITRWADILSISRMSAWNLLRSMQCAGLLTIAGGRFLAQPELCPAALKYTDAPHGVFIVNGRVYLREMLTYWL